MHQQGMSFHYNNSMILQVLTHAWLCSTAIISISVKDVVSNSDSIASNGVQWNWKNMKGSGYGLI